MPLRIPGGQTWQRNSLGHKEQLESRPMGMLLIRMPWPCDLKYGRTACAAFIYPIRFDYLFADFDGSKVKCSDGKHIRVIIPYLDIPVLFSSTSGQIDYFVVIGNVG